MGVLLFASAVADIRQPIFLVAACAVAVVVRISAACVVRLLARHYCAAQAVFVDSDGTVLYGSNCSIGLLTTENTLVLPPDEDGLASFAVQELVAHTLEVRALCHVTAGVLVCDSTVAGRTGRRLMGLSLRSLSLLTRPECVWCDGVLCCGGWCGGVTFDGVV